MNENYLGKRVKYRGRRGILDSISLDGIGMVQFGVRNVTAPEPVVLGSVQLLSEWER